MITTSIDYPDGLPYPLRDGYAIQHVQPFMRTEMQSGRAKQRRTFSSVPSMVTVQWMFQGDAQAAIFEAWFRYTLKDGTEWFNCPLRTPVGTKPYVCRFTEMYQGPTPSGTCDWVISASLEIFERPLIPEEWAEFPEYFVGASIFDIVMNYEWPKA